MTSYALALENLQEYIKDLHKQHDQLKGMDPTRFYLIEDYYTCPVVARIKQIRTYTDIWRNKIDFNVEACSDSDFLGRRMHMQMLLGSLDAFSIKLLPPSEYCLYVGWSCSARFERAIKTGTLLIGLDEELDEMLDQKGRKRGHKV